MSMWLEVVFWYLLVGVILSIGVTIARHRRHEYLGARHWMAALTFPFVWLPWIVWMMWEDR